MKEDRLEFMTNSEIRRYTAKRLEALEEKLDKQSEKIDKLLTMLGQEKNKVTQDVYDMMTKEQLLEEVKKMEIKPKGYALMNKEKLVNALRGEE